MTARLLIILGEKIIAATYQLINSKLPINKIVVDVAVYIKALKENDFYCAQSILSCDFIVSNLYYLSIAFHAYYPQKFSKS